MARMKPKHKKPLGPEEYSKRMAEMQAKFRSPDRKDYARTIAGRGDTHALDGGKISPLQTKKGRAFMEARQKFLPSLPVWEDRNVKNRGSKLNP